MNAVTRLLTVNLQPKLTKRQRAKLLTEEDRALVATISHERLLALHDLTHEEMDRRCGSNVRNEFAHKLATP